LTKLASGRNAITSWVGMGVKDAHRVQEVEIAVNTHSSFQVFCYKCEQINGAITEG
jgi:hypothetical protein